MTGRGCARGVGTVDARVGQPIGHRSWAQSGCLSACVGGLVTSNVHLSNSTSVALLWPSDSTPIQMQDVGSDEPKSMLVDLVAGMRRCWEVLGIPSRCIKKSTDIAVVNWMAVCHAKVLRAHTRY